MTRHVSMAASVVAVLLLVCVQAARVLAAPSAPPSMTASQLAWYMVEDPSEVVAGQSNVYADRMTSSQAISRAEALSITQGATGRTDVDTRVYAAMAHRIYAEPARPAWIVLFPGGEAPQGGPAGAPRVVVKVTV